MALFKETQISKNIQSKRSTPLTLQETNKYAVNAYGGQAKGGPKVLRAGPGQQPVRKWDFITTPARSCIVTKPVSLEEDSASDELTDLADTLISD